MTKEVKMVQFKIQDWIIDSSPYGEGHPYKIQNKEQLEQANNDSNIILWAPEVGEWFWYICSLVKIIDKNNLKYIQLEYSNGSTTEINYTELMVNSEPFIGQLPDAIKVLM